MKKQVLTSPKLPAPMGVWSQAIKVPTRGHLVFVCGMTSRDSTGAVVGEGDISAQTQQVLENIKAALSEGGATMDDVVKVTVYVRDIEDFDKIHSVRREYFPKDPPVSTMVQVSRLVNAAHLIEMDAIAIVD